MTLPQSTLEIIDAELPPVTFNTEHYEAEHGAKPAHNKVGTWRFMPPMHLGKRPYIFYDMTFSAAKKAAVEAFNERPRYGEFVLIP